MSSCIITTILGARPQFVKASVVSHAIARHNDVGGNTTVVERIIHTGQHYDNDMSAVFFDELGIPAPVCNLNISQMSHGAMTGRMLELIEADMIAHRPDWVLVYGDTNSTLAGALAAVKLGIPVAHVEAGLRSWNWAMPEEINRIVTDRISQLLFCPTQTACDNLATEGISSGVRLVGDVMLDVALAFGAKADEQSVIIDRLSLRGKKFTLVTWHRAENTDIPERLMAIGASLSALAQRTTVLLPLHPRTRAALEKRGMMATLGDVQVIEPISYLDMIALERAAQVVVTDSGGVQKEAYFFRRPCITFRAETEWVETVSSGWNRLIEPEPELLLTAHESACDARPEWVSCYGDGNAARQIVDQIVACRF